MQFRTNVVSIK